MVHELKICLICVFICDFTFKRRQINIIHRFKIIKSKLFSNAWISDLKAFNSVKASPGICFRYLFDGIEPSKHQPAAQASRAKIC